MQVESRSFGPLLFGARQVRAPYLLPAAELVNHSDDPSGDRGSERPAPWALLCNRLQLWLWQQRACRVNPTNPAATSPSAVEDGQMVVTAKRALQAGEVRRASCCGAGAALRGGLATRALAPAVAS